ncbi:MAG: AEC family transporter [Paludibacterium sp.]|uniref:AEC family transporter n=1 Tax=Paludibacterium sp. TaxID=1917523 RepID=UPI0025D55A77|nr:AEC family transporter [Paludibacterium sp.]MBV8046860.1 AEC family transporter [Paludibacterium sp.]MBV8647162.1 AEC family transporter [Paludibacterium sp.]
MFASLNQIFLSLIPVTFVIVLGWLAGYKNIVDKKHSSTLATFVMNFSFPCGLFLLTAGSKPAQLFNGNFVLAFWLGLMGMYAISFAIYKFVLGHQSHESAQGAFVCAFPDMAFMGIPIFTALLGKESVLSVAIGNICTSLIMIPVVTWFMSARGAEKQNLGKILMKVLTKPLVFAPVFGILFSLAGFPVPEMLKRSLTLIGGATSGVSLFALGLIMSSFTIKFSRLVGINILLKNILHPALMMGLILVFGITGTYAKQAFLLTAMPTATMTTMFALKYDTLQAESTSSAILGTILSFLTLTVCMVLVGV